MQRAHRTLGCFLITLAVALPAAGQLPAGQLPILPQIGKVLNVPLLLPGLSLATLSVSFEEGANLNLTNLGLGVTLVNPHSPALLARLPPGVTIAPELPLLIRIEPPPSGGLTFSGITRIQLLTLTLLPPPGTSRRMYAAPTGGSFNDATDSYGTSVYRVIGARGGFSEFIVVDDPTPPAQAVADKLGRLSQILTDNAGAIAAPVYAELAAQLAAAQDHQNQGDTAAAIQDIDLFLATAEQHSGSAIPDVWRAARDLVNVAGQLRAAARTLRFSLYEDLDP
jgi:hypothetical protein